MYSKSDNFSFIIDILSQLCPFSVINNVIHGFKK